MLIIQEILGYFLIGIIGMVILSVCYLPIYFILRKRIPLSRQIVCFLLGVCVLVICTATFLEWIIACVLDGRTVIAAERSLNLIPFQFITETWAIGTIIVPKQECFVLEKMQRKRFICQEKD